VQDQLSQARAVVFPSLWYECQPLVPIEALLRGVPVVCGSWGAASEVIEDRVNGVLYHHPNVDDLVQAMGKVASIGAFDSSDLREIVSPDTHVAKLLEVYDQMLERREI
jgi:glycosyltransferase involved in cell wall biosynthesis